MFYTYSQNNSGGGFDYDEQQGISHYVIIEADDSSDADNRAQQVGIYFDDDYSVDCPCCGTRWAEAWDWDGDAVPSIYGQHVVEFVKEQLSKQRSIKWIDGFEIFVHLKDGTVVGLWHPEAQLTIEGASRLEIES